MNTIPMPSAATAFALLAVLATPTILPAQPLSPASCPAGSPFTYAIPNMRPPIAGDIPMLRHTLDQATYPDARCNDNSPAVMYVRPANAGVAGNPIVGATTKWLIFFDGGGGCQNADDCLWTRWCSGSGRVAPGILDRAGKMSSLGAIPAMRSPGGILKVPAPAGQEHFEQWETPPTLERGLVAAESLAALHAHRGAGTAAWEQLRPRRLIEILLAAVVADARGHPRMTTVAPPRSSDTVAFPGRVSPCLQMRHVFLRIARSCLLWGNAR